MQAPNEENLSAEEWSKQDDSYRGGVGDKTGTEHYNMWLLKVMQDWACARLQWEGILNECV